MDNRKELIFDIIVAAVEGGINYWAKVREYHWSDKTWEARVQVRDVYDEEPGWVTVDAEVIERGIAKVKSKGFQVRSDIRKNILLADITDGEEGDLDAECADVIVQAALFGEVVYG